MRRLTTISKNQRQCHTVTRLLQYYRYFRTYVHKFNRCWSTPSMLFDIIIIIDRTICHLRLCTHRRKKLKSKTRWPDNELYLRSHEILYLWFFFFGFIVVKSLTTVAHPHTTAASGRAGLLKHTWWLIKRD